MSTDAGVASRRWLSVAVEIGEQLCESAFHHDGECTWMGTVQHDHDAYHNASFTWESLGPDLYGGASGIALFLSELHARTGDPRFRETALQALRFSAARFSTVPHAFRSGFYSGRIGIAFALARGGELLAAPELTELATAELNLRIVDPNDDVLLDVISGVAGSIGPLLVLSRSLGRDDLRLLAMRFGDLLIARALKGESGWRWGADATGFQIEAPLTGYGHGAGGIGSALHSLFSATGESRFRDAAHEAFRYESSLFSATRDNWPDLRFSSDTSDSGEFGIAWCLGAPGVGLSRLGAAARDDASSRYRLDIDAALRTTRRKFADAADPGTEDFSLCHGWAGLGDFAMLVATELGSAEAMHLASEIAERGAAVNAGTPSQWHCGVRRGAQPSLMLGLAGIGHFYLRLADQSVPSLTRVSG